MIKKCNKEHDEIFFDKYIYISESKVIELCKYQHIEKNECFAVWKLRRSFENRLEIKIEVWIVLTVNLSNVDDSHTLNDAANTKKRRLSTAAATSSTVRQIASILQQYEFHQWINR